MKYRVWVVLHDEENGRKHASQKLYTLAEVYSVLYKLLKSGVEHIEIKSFEQER